MHANTITTQSRGQSFIIKRPRLTKLLDESEARIILLSAPAGYGKTTLAREWLNGREGVAWYSASTASADVAALATGLAAELDATFPSSDDVVARLLSLTRFQQRPDVLARIFSASRRAWPELVVAIDDYHLLSVSGEAEEFVGALVHQLPARFVITTRARPAWVTPRLSVYGEALEIGAEQLTMTHEEVEHVLRSSPATKPNQSILDNAGGWPAVIGLAARTNRRDVPDALPAQLYEFLADDLVATAPAEVQEALEVVAVTRIRDVQVARNVIGKRAEVALREAERRGLLSFEDSQHLSLHPLLADFLIARLRRGSGYSSVYADVTAKLITARRWDECLALAETLPSSDVPVGAILVDALEEMLSTGRVATLRRWVDLARRLRLDDPIVDLADAEAALRGGESRRALTLGSRAADRLDGTDERSRAALVAARAAHLQDLREVAMQWFKRAEAEASTATTRAEAIWGQFLIEDEEQSGALDAAVARVEAASDGTVEHALRVSQANLLLALSNRRVDLAVVHAEAADALIPLASNALTALASMNHKAWVLATAARYEEAITAADTAIAEAERAGVDFVVHHHLFPKASALIGVRRFGAAKHVHSELLARLGSTRDGWALGNIAIQQAKLQLSLGDFERAKDHLAHDPDEFQSPGLRGEYDAYRGLIAAVRASFDEAEMRIERSLDVSRSADAFALTAMARAVIAVKTEREDDDVVRQVGLVLKTGHRDSIVIACRACADIARVVAADGTYRDQLIALLIASHDEAVARAAGLRIRKSVRRNEGLSPRESEVYELMAQGLTNREIARGLYISESTTKVHVKHILEKLGVRSRVEAVRAWQPTAGSYEATAASAEARGTSDSDTG